MHLVWAIEAGEVADTVKKAVFHQHGLNRDELMGALATCCGMWPPLLQNDTPLSGVMGAYSKLKKRYPGYSADALRCAQPLK